MNPCAKRPGRRLVRKRNIGPIEQNIVHLQIQLFFLCIGLIGFFLFRRRFLRFRFRLRPDQMEQVDLAFRAAPDGQLESVKRNLGKMNFGNQRLDGSQVDRQDGKPQNFAAPQIIQRHFLQIDPAGQLQFGGLFLRHDEMHLQADVQQRLGQLEIHFHRHILQVKRDIDIPDVDIQQAFARCLKRLGFTGDRNGSAVDDGGESGFDIMFHVVFDVGDKRNIEIQVPDRMIGFVRGVVKIRRAVGNLNVVE